MENENILIQVLDDKYNNSLQKELKSLSSFSYKNYDENTNTNIFNIISDQNKDNHNFSIFFDNKIETINKTDNTNDSQNNNKIDEENFIEIDLNSNDSELENKSEKNENKINILKESIIFNDNSSNNPTAWNSFSNKISNLKNYLKYNVVSTKRLIHFQNSSYIALFDKIFSKSQFSSKNFESELNKILTITYRTHFTPIIGTDKIMYSSDCGWGCMIRASQMMFSKAILEYKLKKLIQFKEISYNEENKNIELTQDEIDDIKINVISLFFDNMIEFDEKSFLDTEDFNYFLGNYKDLLNEEERKLNKITCNDEDEIIQNSDYQEK